MRKKISSINLPKEAKPWKDGLLYVTPDARFFRKTKTGYVETEKHIKQRKGGACYGVLYVDKRNNWIETLAHTVMAEIFIEKPEGAKSVKMKDGNYLNLSLDNIEWNVSREYLRVKTREGKRKGRYKVLPPDYKKIPGRNAYITVNGQVAKKEPEGDYSTIKVRIKHNELTDVYAVNLYDHSTKKSVNIGIHTLLAETFLADKKSDNDRLVSFRDGNGLNISLDNLYWTSKVDSKDVRKDVKERMSEALPVECRYVDGVYVSIEGRVFVLKDGLYLELNHIDNGKKITVNIPDRHGKKIKSACIESKKSHLL